MSNNERTNITMMVAMDRNGVIGRQDDIPWREKLRADIDHFKRYTMGKIGVLGRKTFQSIPEKYRPLPGRTNVILTRNASFEARGCLILQNPSEVMRIANELKREICILGGGEIYRQFMPVANRLLVTCVHTAIEGGDTFFPEITREWIRKRRLLEHEVDEKNEFSFTIVEYERDLGL